MVLRAFEEKTGRQVDPHDAIVSFIPEYSAYLLKRLEVGRDGKTPLKEPEESGQL